MWTDISSVLLIFPKFFQLVVICSVFLMQMVTVVPGHPPRVGGFSQYFP